jgi:hypothetical protein
MSLCIYKRFLDQFTLLYQGEPAPVHVFGFLSETDDGTNGVADHDPFFEPIVSLPEVSVSTMEEDEVEMLKL